MIERPITGGESMRVLYAAALAVLVAGCSASISASYQLGTDQEPHTSIKPPAAPSGGGEAEGKAETPGAVDSPGTEITGGTASRPKTKEEIEAGRRATRNTILFFGGLGLMILALAMLGAKIYAKTQPAGFLLDKLASQPIWVIGGVGLIGAGCFSWAILPSGYQIGIAAVLLVGVILIVYRSWKETHRVHKNGGSHE
jgi:hypothetical protein